MRFFLIILVCLATKALKAQGYIEYTREISEVKIMVLNDRLNEALECFEEKVFKKYDFIYAEDIFMATQIAIRNSDFNKAFVYLDKCALQGISLSFLKYNKTIKLLINDVRWSIFEKKFDKLSSQYYSKINLPIRQKIDSMFAIDQALTPKQNGSILSMILSYPKWRYISKKHAKAIIEITKKYGYPGERLIGVNSYFNEQKDSSEVASFRYGKINERKTFAMLLHYFSGPVKGYNEIFYKNVISGFLPVATYASYNDFMAQWGKKIYDNNYYNEWHTNPNKSKISEINKRRDSVGLYPYEIRLQLVKRRLSSFQTKTNSEIIYIPIID